MLRAERDPPKFFVAVLTDINGRRHYCAVLAFSEAVDKALLEPSNRQAADEELEEEAAAAEGAAGAGALASIVVGGGGGGGGPSSRVSRTTSLPRHVVPGVSLPTNGAAVMFAPKCLVLVSRHDLPDVLRSCLRVIYTAYSECLVGAGGERVRLERLVGNLLGSVFVPLPGGPQLRFSLGAGDRMALQPTLHPAVPRTGDSAAVLFRQLGVRNVLALFCACMTELKVLLYSCSFARLSAAARALVALMFPMRYSHVFIPVLPSSLLEVLATPTPFVIGVSSTHEPDVADLLDVITVDLDGGAITVPENMTVPSLPPRLHRRVTRELTMVLHPELSLADDAFPELAPSAGRATVSSTSGVVLDKELRAVMLRYGTCLLYKLFKIMERLPLKTDGSLAGRLPRVPDPGAHPPAPLHHLPQGRLSRAALRPGLPVRLFSRIRPPAARLHVLQHVRGRARAALEEVRRVRRRLRHRGRTGFYSYFTIGGT